jgi:hypothetical protein
MGLKIPAAAIEDECKSGSLKIRTVFFLLINSTAKAVPARPWPTII